MINLIANLRICATNIAVRGEVGSAIGANPDKQDYSIYLSNKSIIGEVNNLTVGFDAGNNHSVTKLTYDRKGETSKREVRE